MNMLDQLNNNQREAVMFTNGPLLILAGPGSGKTRVITHRIAYLIKEKLVPPSAIFAVTFTNKACEEMKKRVIDMIGPIARDVFIKTFHSASVYILRRYGDRIGIPSNFAIYDTTDQESVVKDILMSMNIDPHRVKPSSLVAKISEIKEREEYIDGIEVTTLFPKYSYFDFKELFDEYHKVLEKNCALDFNDLLIRCVELLRNVPEVLEKLQSRWKFFMIDEYQDTNHAQYLLAMLLSRSSRNICVVGDDDQSIYSWRGADIRNILEFERDFPDAKVIVLEKNYRSHARILDAAKAVVKNNVQRKEKNIQSIKNDGELPVYCRAANENAEAAFVVGKITEIHKNERVPYSGFAVFYRTNAQSRIFETVLRGSRIPYKIIGGLKFFDRKEIKDLLYYLRFIVNTQDLVALKRIINIPPRGIGKATIEKIQDAAYRHNIAEWDVIMKAEELKIELPKGVAEFRNIIASAIDNIPNVPHKIRLADYVVSIFDSTGYIEELKNENSPENKSRLENIEELINAIYEYSEQNPEATLQEFLQDIALLTSEEDPELRKNINAVNLMTVHNAKGLEFPVVFLTGMEEGLFPHVNSQDTEEGIEEERRLCYVGITRAMNKLYITSAELRRQWGNISYRQPSRFVFEIPQQLRRDLYFCDIEGEVELDDQCEQQINYCKTRQCDFADSVGWNGLRSLSGGSNFKVSDLVSHPRFGYGKIVRIEGFGENVKLTIDFERGERKVFLEKYTPLVKIR
ncbi:MAG: UvrD-helicase domain-containing protein [Spirochaetes bacterium]|nr:UvrD-helicase domain-containing protein [Spirochaetota bacterium]